MDARRRDADGLAEAFAAGASAWLRTSSREMPDFRNRVGGYAVVGR
jgi:hypothetical protein